MFLTETELNSSPIVWKFYNGVEEPTVFTGSIYNSRISLCTESSAYNSAKPSSPDCGTSFSNLSRHMEHTLCFEQLYSCLFQHLYTCTSTNLRVVWEHPYCDQWEPSNITRLIRVDQSQGSKSAKRYRERERVERKRIEWRKPLYFIERLALFHNFFSLKKTFIS